MSNRQEERNGCGGGAAAAAAAAIPAACRVEPTRLGIAGISVLAAMVARVVGIPVTQVHSTHHSTFKIIGIIDLRNNAPVDQVVNETSAVVTKCFHHELYAPPYFVALFRCGEIVYLMWFVGCCYC